MMSDKKFKGRVMEVSKEELRPLIHELRGLFFKRSESSYTYNHTIATEEFRDICKRNLKALKRKKGERTEGREGGPARKRSKSEVV